MKLCNSMMMTMMKDRLAKTDSRRDGGCRKERLRKEELDLGAVECICTW